ncbi:MAG: PIN domain-containing protein [Chloroflexota bacterium]|nr:PIN domain-containing protein [Chloroflexota bacterium]
MPREVFVDSGAWLALFDPQEAGHTLAGVTYKSLLQRYARAVTTNLVIAESYTLIYRRVGYLAATTFLVNVRSTLQLLKLYSDEALDAQAESLLNHYADQDFSYVDAVSFALMRTRRITTAFSFDHHFRIAGFTLIPPFTR